MTIAGQCPGLFDFVNNSVNAMISSHKIGSLCSFTQHEEPTTQSTDFNFNTTDNLTNMEQQVTQKIVSNQIQENENQLNGFLMEYFLTLVPNISWDY